MRASARRAYLDAREYEPTPQRFAVAEFVAESNNAYDSNAVKVMIGGNQVGYIPAGNTGTYLRLIKRLVGQGLPATGRAWIYILKSDTNTVRVRVAVAWPLRCIS